MRKMPGSFLEFFLIPTCGPITALGPRCGAGALLQYVSDMFFWSPSPLEQVR
jgi:hypothetical protein